MMSSTCLLYTILVIFLVGLAIELGYYFLPYIVVLRKTRKAKRAEIIDEEAPGVSVIICSRNESCNLENFLPLVLEQNYPNFEVILVDDGSVDDTLLVAKEMQKKYPHLYVTSIPNGKTYLSRKKVAIMVGIKAAKNDILLFTDADCRPYTGGWIREMALKFTPETSFVLGYGGYVAGKSFVSRMISYDTLFIAMQYMGLAYYGMPYMAVGRNLAYRKSMFEANEGFKGFLNIASGDDDILINAYGTRQNTKIQPILNAKTLSLPKKSFKDWFYQKQRHLTTSVIYKPAKKIVIGLEPLARALVYAGAIAGLCLFATDMTAVAIFAGGLLLKIVSLITIVNLTAKRYKEPYFWLSAIVFDILLPLITLYILFYNKIRKNKIIKWK